MDSNKLGSGDNEVTQPVTFRLVEQIKSDDKEEEKESPKCEELQQEEDANEKNLENEITPQMIDDNEAKLKDRIAQCRNIIESLKVELNAEKTKLENQNKSSKLEEKSKLENQNKYSKPRDIEIPTKCTTSHYVSASSIYYDNLTYSSGIYRDCVDSKLNCDENLVEYEKQLQKYQNTLNMAQIEKKNAIRKQMLAKAYRLKLLEVENQCNIELLRVKQNMQCLEPLKLIASKWKTNTDMYDGTSYELIPRYPELIASSNCDINICRAALDNQAPLENSTSKDDSLSPD